MFRSSRSAHRAIVPIAALPLMLTAITGLVMWFRTRRRQPSKA
ncbi:MAG: hypothetical protein NTY67_00190 [Cyanobacteria bacterium]|nr:hypothetical protein [Cyanobacteriota bacterium]